MVTSDGNTRSIWSFVHSWEKDFETLAPNNPIDTSNGDRDKGGSFLLSPIWSFMPNIDSRIYQGWAAESHAPGKRFRRSKHWQPRDPRPQALKTTPLHTHTIPTSSFPFLRLLPPEVAFDSPSSRLTMDPSEVCSRSPPFCSWPWEGRI